MKNSSLPAGKVIKVYKGAGDVEPDETGEENPALGQYQLPSLRQPGCFRVTSAVEKTVDGVTEGEIRSRSRVKGFFSVT